jgi:hypothetical protein
MPSRLLLFFACIAVALFMSAGATAPKVIPSQQPIATVSPGEPDAQTLAGYWEAKDPFAHGSAQVGLLIKILTDRTVPRSPNSGLVAGPQQFTEFDIGFYQRTSPTAVRIGWFMVAPDGGASWDGHRLQIKFNDEGPGVFIPSKLWLNLAFNQAKQIWVGTYTRNHETRRIALTRPIASIPNASTRFIGSWRESPTVAQTRCIYIAQGADRAVVAWRDSRSVPIGESRHSGLATVWQTDGDALGVYIDGDTLSLQEGLYWSGVAGGNLPRKFVGKLSPDGLQIIGIWAEIGSMPLLRAQPPPSDSATLVKTTSRSCLRF